MIAARETCHRLGVPHVTLDLREEFRRAVVAPFVRGYARGETPNPCIRCNGGFRFAELLAFARRAGAERRSRPATTRASSSATAGCSSRAPPTRRRIRATCSPRSTRRSSRASPSRSASRTRRRPAPRPSAPGSPPRASPRARRRASSPATTTAPSSGGRDSSRAEGAIVDEDGNELGRHDGFWRFTPGQRRGLGLAAPGAALRPRQPPGRERRRRRPARVARAHAGRRHAAASTPTSSASRRSSATARRPSRARSSRRLAASASQLDEPAYGVAPGQAAVLYDGDLVVGHGTDHARALRSARGCWSRHSRWGDLWRLALAVFLFAVGLSLAWFFVRLAGTVDARFRR